jgi:hypothetical protein
MYFYLMQRFDVSEGFPHRTIGDDIGPYIGECYVIYDKNGNKLPFGGQLEDFQTLSLDDMQRLKRFQDAGHQIRGDVYPFYKNPINVEGDVEVYLPFPKESALNQILNEQGINILFENDE